MFFEQAREHAEREFKANNKDALVRCRPCSPPRPSPPPPPDSPRPPSPQALTKWGGALLELAHFRQGGEAYEMIEEAIEKFKQALDLDAGRHDALWCLGNAYTSQGFLSADGDAAGAFFTKAGECFQTAVDQEPGNESYRRALDMSAKAPQLYEELQRQLQAAGAAMGSPRRGGDGGGASGSGGGGRGGGAAPAPLISDYWYDVAGWVALVGVGFGIAMLSRTGTAAGT